MQGRPAKPMHVLLPCSKEVTLRSCPWTAVSPQVMQGTWKAPRLHRRTVFSGGKQFWNILQLQPWPLFAVTCTCNSLLARGCICADFQAALVAIVTDSSSWAGALWFSSPPQGCSCYSNAWCGTTAGNKGCPISGGRGAGKSLWAARSFIFPTHCFDHTHLEDRGRKS